MKKLLFLQVSLVSITWVLFNSCKKYDHHFLNKLCRIESVNAYAAEGILRRTVLYNQWNNPVSVKFDEAGTGRADYLFTYDNQNRLIKYQGYETHYFSYDHRGYAIVDTIFANYTGHELWIADKLSYDGYGRIIRSESKLFSAADPNQPGLGETTITNYQYDGHGNLVLPNVLYDNKINFLRTNRVWMLIERNYSQNNYFYQNSTNPLMYNEYNLPVRPGGASFLRHGTDDIFYNCKLSTTPK